MLLEESNPQLKRVEFALRATGVKPKQVRNLRSGIHSRGYLPHVKREGATYFVTFRLADSLPLDAFFKIKRERAQRLAQLFTGNATTQAMGAAVSSSEALREIERDYFQKMEQYLDHGSGECWLRLPAIARVVSGALRFFDHERYLLKAWVIMPTHVHAVLWPMPNHTLSAILKSWKGYSSREANKLLHRLGRFWQPEAYDHWIRNDAELERCCRYVINNPVKARLCKTAADWAWSSAWRGTS